VAGVVPEWVRGLALRTLLISSLFGLCAGVAVGAAAGAEPPQRYSYYSPGDGTVNMGNLELEPQRFRLAGRRLPEDLFVLTGISRRLMRLGADGSVRWMLNVNAGGGAYGLASYEGRLLVAYAREVLVVDPKRGDVLARVALFDASYEPINFIRVQGDRLIAGESSDRSRIVITQIGIDGKGNLTFTGAGVVHSRTQHPRDALFLDDDTLAVADTFGHAVVLLDRSAGWRETRWHGDFFPNMLQLASDGDLLVLSEHANRIARWDLRTGARTTVISCPDPLFSDPYTRPQQVVSEERATRTRETPARQRCTVDVAGNQTLYAANGFFVAEGGRMWVADADNHRVALFVDGVFWGAVGEINHPVRVIPLSAL
jgi:hypothetical protein